MGERPTREQMADHRAHHEAVTSTGGPLLHVERIRADLLAEVDALAAEKDALRVELEEEGRLVRVAYESLHPQILARAVQAEAERDALRVQRDEVTARGYGDDAYIIELERRIKVADAITANNATTAELLAERDALRTALAESQVNEAKEAAIAAYNEKAAEEATARAEKAEAALSRLREAAAMFEAIAISRDPDVSATLDAALADLPPDTYRSEVRAAALEGLGPVIAEVSAERAKQRAKWGPDHDDDHTLGELAIVAASLAVAGTDARVVEPHDILDEHGFDRWGLRAKTGHRERLIIAAALLVAEVERMARTLSTRDAGGER